MTYDADHDGWTDCSARAVAHAANMANAGQRVRIYFEAYDPCESGEPIDESNPMQRFVEARAHQAIELFADNTPTIVFEDDDGEIYWYTRQNRTSGPTRQTFGLGRIKEWDDKERLFLEGTDVAFAVPDDARISSHLEDRGE